MLGYNFTAICLLFFLSACGSPTPSANIENSSVNHFEECFKNSFDQYYERLEDLQAILARDFNATKNKDSMATFYGSFEVLEKSQAKPKLSPEEKRNFSELSMDSQFELRVIKCINTIENVDEFTEKQQEFINLFKSSESTGALNIMELGNIIKQMNVKEYHGTVFEDISITLASNLALRNLYNWND